MASLQAKIILENDENSDVEIIPLDDRPEQGSPNQSDHSPLMLLLHSLSRSQNTTFMTNCQIYTILQIEFGIPVEACHKLEIDIFSNVFKRYLKEWPHWDEVERISNKLIKANDVDALNKVLNKKYKKLKEYLQGIIEATKPLARKAVIHVNNTIAAKTKVAEENENRKGEILDNSEVVLQVHCTREQLKHLIVRKPLNNSIFNYDSIPPTRSDCKTLSYVDILNVFWLNIKINLPYFVFTREIAYRLNHRLVNKVLNENITPEELDTDLLLIPVKKFKRFDSTAALNQLSCVLKNYLKINNEMEKVLNPLFEVFKADLVEAMTCELRVPGTYRRCANKYRYVRYLYVENEGSNDPKFDLQLEETAAPSYQFYVRRLTGGIYDQPPKEIEEWLKIECMFCKIRIKVDLNLREALQTHYKEMHQHEPDWKCTNCDKTFTMEFLAQNKWKHCC